VEGESARIGRLSVPVPLVQCLRAAACIEIAAAPQERLAYLLRDYAYLGDDPEALAQRLGVLVELHSRETVQRWQDWARTHQLAPLFEELMRLHYDPHYDRSQARNFAQWDARQRVAAPDLSPDGIARLAQAMLGLA
ncbi:MAG: tRNA 2-selenouridine(34) synthase MnmH, partial [Proteobacteria bacterium]|nr:tRNA 2-selenouridine(34) synthase MnmH [Pseudomonadota bacterium]